MSSVIFYKKIMHNAQMLGTTESVWWAKFLAAVSLLLVSLVFLPSVCRCCVYDTESRVWVGAGVGPVWWLLLGRPDADARELQRLQSDFTLMLIISHMGAYCCLFSKRQPNCIHMHTHCSVANLWSAQWYLSVVWGQNETVRESTFPNSDLRLH